jgi:HD-GYP domain-containing protein (c-di-GMP phosphodiesterase class II)
MKRTKVTIDYKKELEVAAKNMILVHEPDIIIKMILRRIVQKVGVRHAAILLQHKDKDAYLIRISRRYPQVKISTAFARVEKNNPLISFFAKHKNRQLFNDGALLHEEVKKILKKDIKPNLKKLLTQVLQQMDELEAVVCIPSYFREDLLGMFLLGKKANGKRFSKGELGFFMALSSEVAMAMRNAQLFKALQLELDKERRLFMNTTVALAAAIEAKDRYTHGHTARVTSLSLAIARRLVKKHHNAIGNKFLEDLHIASLLHDIGKIGIPEYILNKEGPLDDKEKREMKAHPQLGVNILQFINELADCVAGVKYHHERYDGNGYPEGLKGKQIPLIAAIISVADAFDAMITERPYREVLTRDEAVQEIMQLSGKQFNPEVTAAFMELYREGKV